MFPVQHLPVPLVTHCVCRNISFAELLSIQRAAGCSYEALRDQTGCGERCAYCEPYIKIALRTGKPAIPLYSRESSDEPEDGGLSGLSDRP